MSSGRWRRRVGLGLLPLLLFVAGCNGDRSGAEVDANTQDRASETSTAEPGAGEITTTVKESGFRVELGDLVAEGPPGVAPAGTEVTLREIETPDVAREAGMPLAGSAFDITLSDGLQPAEPVRISLALGGADQPVETLAFLTQDSETGEWTGLPVEVVDGTATVQLEHFSIGLFSWFGDAVDAFTDDVLRFTKMRYDPPDCDGREVEVDSRTYRAATDNTAVYTCVERDDAGVRLTVHSNSPYVWTVTTDTATAKGLPGEAPLDAGQVVTLAVFNLLNGYDYDSSTALVPGGVAPVLLHDGATGTSAIARVDAGLGLIAIAAAGVGMLGAPYQDLVEIGECAADVVGAGVDPELVAVLRTVLDCSANTLTGVAGFLAAGLLTLVPLLATQLTGVVGEITGANRAALTVTSEPLGPPEYAVPEYCDQPERTAPIGETEVDQMVTWLEGPVAWPAAWVEVVAMVCTAGGVTWPGVLLFYGAGGDRIAEVFLADLQPSAYRGSFALDGATVADGQLTVPYAWEVSGGSGGRSGEVVLTWDAAKRRPVIADVGGGADGPSDWFSGDYELAWTGGVETFVEGCSRGPEMPQCTAKIVAATSFPTDPDRAVVLMYGYDSEGFPVHVELAVWQSLDGVRTRSDPALDSVRPGIGCDVELTFLDEDTVAMDQTACAEGGRLATYTVLGSHLSLD